MSELYTEFFNLRERPFTLLPDPDFLYWSRQHVRAFSVLEYGIVSRAPITVITGDVGAGKTTLLQKLLGSIERDATLGLVSNVTGDRGDTRGSHLRTATGPTGALPRSPPCAPRRGAIIRSKGPLPYGGGATHVCYVSILVNHGGSERNRSILVDG